MKIDGPLVTQTLAEVPAAASRMEAEGYDGVFTFEGPHDPFLPLMLAAEHSERLELTTAIAVAFARNPMTIATTANDLQLASQGRFVLGLGTQIKPHIEKRFSMPWSHPAKNRPDAFCVLCERRVLRSRPESLRRTARRARGRRSAHDGSRG